MTEPHSICYRIALLLVTIFASCFTPVSISVVSGAHGSAFANQHPQALSSGKPVEAEIAGGDTHSYQLTLSEQQFARVVVVQRGLDLTVRLLGPDSNLITDVNNPNGAQEPEQVSVIAPSAGQYTIEVRPRRKDVARTRYEIKLEELRSVSPQDALRISAERLAAEAELILRNQRTADLLQRAVIKYEQSLSSYKSASSPQVEIGILNQLGEIYLALAENEKAVERLEQALVILRSHTDMSAKSRVSFNLGKAYSSLGDTGKAFDLYTETLSLSRLLSSRSLEAQALSNLGALHGRMGEWGKALDHFNQVRALYQSAQNTRAEVSALFNIGVAYSNMGEPQKALEIYGRALQIMRELKYPFGESYALYNMGTVHNSNGDPQKAVEALNEALKLSQTVGDKSQEARVVNELGRSHKLLGESQKALELYLRALTINATSSHLENEAIVLREIGLLYESLGDSQKAGESFNRVVALARTVKNRELEAHALYELSGIALRSGRLVEARSDIEASIALVESIRSGVSPEDLRNSYFAKVRDYYNRYIDVLMRDHERRPTAGLNALALHVSERARARGVLELLNEARVDIREGIDPFLLKQERAFQERLNAKEQQRTQLLSDSKSSAARIAAIEKELSDLITEYHSLMARIRVASPQYAELTQPNPQTIHQIQQLLDSETLLLEYILGDERSYVWAVTPQSVQSFELPSREKIEAASRRLYDLLTARNRKVEDETPQARRARITTADGEFIRAGSELSQLILGPTVDVLGTKRLVIVSEGALQYIPFAALSEPTRKSQSAPSYLPLAVKHEVVSLPSISVLTALRQNRTGPRPEPRTVAVIADPIFSVNDLRISMNKRRFDQASLTSGPTVVPRVPDDVKRSGDQVGLESFSRLPFSRREADEISAIVPENKRMVAVDFAANKQTAQSDSLGRFSILHFATHGLLNSQRPELSGLVFSLVDEKGNAQDGFLRLHEIFNLKLGADLVVLSACQTALGKEIRGEGLVGLTRGFMYSGVPRVVSGLWRVDDRATSELMRRFYRQMLTEGVKPSAALRAAQQALLKEERWKSPYYWAPFIIQGDWR